MNKKNSHLFTDIIYNSYITFFSKFWKPCPLNSTAFHISSAFPEFIIHLKSHTLLFHLLMKTFPQKCPEGSKELSYSIMSSTSKK